jgi:hypothetical protein
MTSAIDGVPMSQYRWTTGAWTWWSAGELDRCVKVCDLGMLRAAMEELADRIGNRDQAGPVTSGGVP